MDRITDRETHTLAARGLEELIVNLLLKKFIRELPYTSLVLNIRVTILDQLNKFRYVMLGFIEFGLACVI